MGPEDFGRTREISSDPVLPNAASCRYVPGASLQLMQLSLALRLKGPRAQFFAVPASPPPTGRHLRRMSPGDFGGTRGILGDRVSPNAFRCRDVPGASIYDVAAFGLQAHRPPSLILRRVRMCPPGGYLHRVGPGNIGGTRRISGYPVSPNTVFCRDVPGHPSMMQLLLALRLTRPRGQFFALLACTPHWTAFARHASRALRQDSGASVQWYPSIMQLLLALRLTGTRSQFFAMPHSPQEGICMAWPYAGDFVGTRGISGDPESTNAVRCRDVTGSSVHNAAAFALGLTGP